MSSLWNSVKPLLGRAPGKAPRLPQPPCTPKPPTGPPPVRPPEPTCQNGPHPDLNALASLLRGPRSKR